MGSDRSTYETVREVARRVVRFRRYPPPDAPSWTDTALDELVQSFLADRDGPARLIRLRISLTEEREFALVVERMLKNYLADRGRRTEVGRLHRRLRHVLSHDPCFVALGHDIWGVVGVTVSNGPVIGENDLSAAARQVARGDGLARERVGGNRGAKRELVTAMCAAVIRAAGGPLPLSTITAVLAPVLGVSDVLPGGLTRDEPHGLAVAAGAVPAPGPARSIAREIWDRLSERERLLLPHLSDPVRCQGKVIGTGHSQAAVTARRLRERLRFLLDGEDRESQREVMGHLLEIQAFWTWSWERARTTKSSSPLGLATRTSGPTCRPGSSAPSRKQAPATLREETRMWVTHATIRNINTGAGWEPLRVMRPDVDIVRAHGAENAQPPDGFLDAGHQYEVTGRDQPSGRRVVATGLRWDPADSEPPLIYSFRRRAAP